MERTTGVAWFFLMLAGSIYPLVVPWPQVGVVAGAEPCNGLVALLAEPNPHRFVLALALTAALLHLFLLLGGGGAASEAAGRRAVAAASLALGLNAAMRVLFRAPLHTPLAPLPDWVRFVPIWLYPGTGVLLLFPLYLRPRAPVLLQATANLTAVLFLAASHGETVWTLATDCALYAWVDGCLQHWRVLLGCCCGLRKKAPALYRPLTGRLVNVGRGFLGMRPLAADGGDAVDPRDAMVLGGGR